MLAFKGHIGDIYCLSAKRLGMECPNYERMLEGFHQAYKRTSKDYPCFGHKSLSTKDWWKICVRRSFEDAGYPYADDDARFSRLFQRIYANFGSTRAYRAFDDAVPFMRWAKRRGLQVAICSNETERYGDSIMPLLGLDEDVDFMVFSKMVGYEKPHPAMFRNVMVLGGVSNPAEVLHIGDSLRKDYEGAVKLGMRALLLDRFDTKEAQKWREDGIPVLPSLDATRKWIVEHDLVEPYDEAEDEDHAGSHEK